jgi:RNA polymerase sigma factor (sigma-70 family)
MRDVDFECLYAEHAEALFAFLAYRTGDRVLAEDLLADTFEHALRARRRYDRPRARVKTWIYSIALNLLRDHARRRTAEARALQRRTRSRPRGRGRGRGRSLRSGPLRPSSSATPCRAHSPDLAMWSARPSLCASAAT